MPKFKRGLEAVRVHESDYEAAYSQDLSAARDTTKEVFQPSFETTADVDLQFTNGDSGTPVQPLSHKPSPFVEISAEVPYPSIEVSPEHSYVPFDALPVVESTRDSHLYVGPSTETHPDSGVQKFASRADFLQSELRYKQEAHAALEAEMLETKAFYEKRMSFRDDIIRGICEVQQHIFDSDAHMQQMWEKSEETSLVWKRRCDDTKMQLSGYLARVISYEDLEKARVECDREEAEKTAKKAEKEAKKVAKITAQSSEPWRAPVARMW